MELMIRGGDYVPDGVGGFRQVNGREELIQRVLFKLAARRGAFPFQETLGSRLRDLAGLPAAQRQSAAEQYAAEALEGEPISIEAVELSPMGEGIVSLRAELSWKGEKLSVSLNV